MNLHTNRPCYYTITFLIVLAFSLALAACGGAPAAPPTEEAVIATEAPATATPEPSPTQPPPTSTPEPTPTPTTLPSPTPEISSEMQAAMDEIEAQVSAIRGLAMPEAITVDVQSLEEIEQSVADRLAAEYTEEEEFQELVTYSFLGLIPPDFDIRGFYQAMSTEDPRSAYHIYEDLMVIAAGTEFDSVGKMSYASESVVAMLDEAYDLDGALGLNDEICDLSAEHCRAVQAMVAGDASLASAMWMVGNTTSEEQAEINAAGQEVPLALSNAPAFYQEDLLFPYSVGVQFANVFYQQGGWEAVNQAYVYPPTSTEQIMHPERYPMDSPVEVSLPDLQPVLGAGWELLDQDVFGEWYTLLMLTSGVDPAARLSVDAAMPAVTGWSGDVYQVYFNPESQQVVLVLKTQWENADEATEFYTALNQHVLARFDLAETETDLIAMFQAMQLGHAQFQIQNDTTYYILSPSAEISAAVLEAVLE
jgi:hypothetical protein